MKLTAKESFPKFLTKGKEYESQHVTHDSVLITDDSGELSGWNLDRFETSNDHLEEFGWELDEQEFKTKIERV